MGVGTKTPTQKLHVEGNIFVSGNINAKYQDVAEWVESGHALQAGTVVVLNRELRDQVLPSSSEYDATVAGVVSEKPGLILGEVGESKSMIATTGRVKVRVDTSRAPISIGDLLVTSAKSGVAMKSEPTQINGRNFHQPGTLIGKAHEPLDSGESEILVLLSLQ